MIDVSHKFMTLRYAKAEGIFRARPEIIERIKQRSVPKGDVLEIARAAGISAAKRTMEWVIFCHPIPLDWVEVSFEIGIDRIRVWAEVRATWKSGVETEAMSAVSSALINMYDMLKPLDDDLIVGEIRLVGKSGGKSDYTDTRSRPIHTAILVISNAVAAGGKKDDAGQYIRQFLQNQAVEVCKYEIVPDDRERISQRLCALVDDDRMDLILTTGGTGLEPKDCTPEATRAVIEKEVPGIAETMRTYGSQRTPYAMLSQAVCGIRKNSLIVNLPGSSRGVRESLEVLFPGLFHGFGMLWDE